MLFLINNPLVLFTAVVVIGFMTFMGSKIVKEIGLNRLLRDKQGVMRVKIPKTGLGKRIGILGSTALAPLVVIAVVLTVGTANTIQPTGDILAVHNSSDILDIYDSFQDKMSTYNTWRTFDGFNMVMEESVDEAAQDDSYDAGEEGSDDFSGTNNQVDDVDEMDNVITDGKYIYSIQNNGVNITLAYTEAQKTEVLSNYKEINYLIEDTDCPSGYYVTGLYVDDDYLVVVGSQYDYNCEFDFDEQVDGEFYYYDFWYGYNNNVKVYVYDKNDDFSLESEYDLSGNLVGTRKIDDNLFIVTNSYIPFSNSELNLDEFLPYYVVEDTTVVVDYTDIVYVEGTSPNSFTSFYAIDIDHDLIDMEVVLGDSGYNLYVSTDNIYLVGSIYYFTAFAELLDVEDPISETKTAILKIAITDADLEYVTTGIVSGYTLNQFSMDEHNGNLRIATTTGWWGAEVNNRLFILDKDLNQISVIEHLGKVGETIKSVRFVGDYGYIVTFEQTDPFYVLNLSNPEEPFEEGILEVTGFSAMLQPLGENFMLGIGFGDNHGGTNGLKISIYDISDKENPFVFDEVIFDYEDFGWGYSTATYNHKDLLVSLSKGIIALPFSTYSWDQEDGYSYDSGILVYHFDELTGLSEGNFIRHETGSEEEVYVYKIKFIDDYFYTVSNKYIKASTIIEPETILDTVVLPGNE